MALCFRRTLGVAMTVIVCWNCGNEDNNSNPFSMREEKVVWISKCQNCITFHQNKKDMSNERAEVERPRQKKR